MSTVASTEAALDDSHSRALRRGMTLGAAAFVSYAVISFIRNLATAIFVAGALLALKGLSEAGA